MRKSFVSARQISLIVVGALLATTRANAQITSTQPVPPDVKSLAPGNVDMRTGVYVVDSVDVNIGLPGQTLDYERQSAKPGTPFTDNWTFKVTKQPAVSGGNYYTVQNQSVGHTFYSADGTSFGDASMSPDGVSQLQIFPSGSQKYFVYTMPDGTQITFNPSADGTGPIANSIVRPDGLTFQISGGLQHATRITDNRGYMIIALPGGTAGTIAKACVLNLAFVTPPSTNSCPAGARSVSYTYSGKDLATFTDLIGQVSSITYGTNTQTYFKPGIAQSYMTLQLGPSPTNELGNVVTQETYTNGPTIVYSYDTYGGDPPTSIDFGSGWTINGTASADVGWGLLQTYPTQTPAITPTPNSVCDEITRCHHYDYNGQFTAIVADHFPSGRTISYTYDGATSVITKVEASPPPGGTDPLIDWNYTYDCSVLINCHKPKTATDPRGNVYDFTYDSTNGNLTTVTRPAPAAGGVRPQTRYTYTQFTARYRNTSGVVGPAPSPVWVLTQISECRTTASCTGTADETRTTFTYPTGTGAYNPWPVSKTVAAGDGSLSATINYTYDQDGNVLTTSGPLANQTTRFRYDAMRRLVGIVGPDPDGSTGPLLYRAIRYTYDPAGRLTKVERGTVLSQSDADWANFAPLLVQNNTYDIQDRLTQTTVSPAGGAAQTTTQMSYDTFGRLQCSAVRMDPAQWSSQTDACTPQTTGPNGPDRITKYGYNAAGDLILQQGAYGTADQADELTLTYTNNGNTYSSDGMVSTLKDAENNLTTFEYDGHDRLLKTRYPLPTKGSNASSTTDYQQLTYDLASNITSILQRDGVSIGFGFDNLNRVKLKTLPNGEAAVSYTYDNLDQLTSAVQGGQTLSFAYDALSRRISDQQGSNTVSRQFDLAGNLTRTTWPDGFYVSYDRLLTGELTKVHENGATTGVGVLSSYTYDNLGDRLSRTFGNGVVQNYTYDGISRLASLSNDLPGTTNDFTATFAYNPASQIIQTVRTGDTYAFTGQGSGTTAYTSNGLNQQATIGGAAATWDTKGNLHIDPTTSRTYSFAAENRLSIVSSGATLYYDPLDRVTQYVTTSSTLFRYDGPSMAFELSNPGGAVLRRYVRGDGLDEPLVWYEGSGTTDRRFLSTDERGSVISATDSSGNLIGINTYDEYGKPGASNIGRFQYTGQAWLPEAGVYHYKTREYLPHLGTFAQTDPLRSEGDSPNLYVYGLDDPVNLIDPLGLRYACVDPGGGCSWFGGGIGGISLADLVGGMSPFSKLLFQLAHQFESPPRTCPKGRYLSFSGGVGGTAFAALVGASLGVNATLSIPTDPTTGAPGLRGTRVSVTGSATPLLGLGLFAGFGPSLGFSDEQPSGRLISGSATNVFQMGGGFGEGAEMTGALTPNIDIAGAAGRVALGGYVALGRRFSGTLSTPPLGCHQ